MVQILPNNQRPGFGEQLLAGIDAARPGIERFIQDRRQGDFAQQMGLNPDHLRALSPESREKFLVEALTKNIDAQRAKKTLGIDYLNKNNQSPQAPPSRNREDIPELIANKPKLADFSLGPNEQPLAKPKSGGKGYGNAPQPETPGKKRSLRTPEQLAQRGVELAQQYNQAGFPTTLQQGLELARQEQQDLKSFNQDVEADTKQRVESQRNYGQIAQEKLKNVLESPTDEQLALFKRKGESLAGQYTSEAEIERELAKEARIFKNSMANISRSIGPRRLGSGIKQDLLGNSRAAEKNRNGIRIKLEPLLKEGLYDTARNLLSELGYYREERENIIADLGEGSKRSLAEFPSISSTDENIHATKPYLPPEFTGEIYTPEQQELFRENLLKTLSNDNSANLILLRKAYEDKGVNWELFKNTLDDMILNGEVKLNEDQFNMLDDLDQPPLNRLEKILNYIGLIGR